MHWTWARLYPCLTLRLQENESCAKEDEDGIDADYEDPYSFRKHGEYLKDDAGTANDDVDVSNAHGQEALHGTRMLSQCACEHHAWTDTHVHKTS